MKNKNSETTAEENTPVSSPNEARSAAISMAEDKAFFQPLYALRIYLEALIRAYSKVKD